MEASVFSLQKGRDGFDRRASWASRAGTARRINGERKMGKRAIKQMGEKLTPVGQPTKISPIFSTKRDARREFAALIQPFSNGDIATDLDGSKETVKCWKAARAFPGGVSLLELANRHPAIRNWVLAKLGVNQMPEIMSDPKVLTAIMAAAYQVMHQSGPDGEAVRAALEQASGKARNGR